MADSSSTSSKSPGASSMADLMSGYKGKIVGVKKGDVVEGAIKKLSKNEVTVDIGGKTDALVLEKDRRLMNTLLSSLKVGDKVNVSILNPESDLGMPVVSLRRFMENSSWKNLDELKKAQTPVDITVSDVTKGGYVATSDSGVAGFLPQSHVQLSRSQQIVAGTRLKVVILELNRVEKKVIFSQKHTVSDEDFAIANKNLKKGEKIEVSVVNITPFGLFATVPLAGTDGKMLDGLIHISELSWDKISEIGDKFAVGQKLEAVILGIDKDAKRVDLSLKRFTEDPFVKIAEKYPVDKKVTTNVISVDSNGVTLDLGDGVEGVIRKEKIPPAMQFEVGKNVSATVSEVDTRRRKISLVPVLLEKPLGYR